MLAVRACKLVCCGTAREEQVRRRPHRETRTCPHRPDSPEQDRMSRRSADTQ
jgi:hypothetical protein